MLVGEVMTPQPVTVGPADTALSAYHKMRNGHFRHLPVVEGERLIGILTDRDLRRLLPVSVDEETTENWLHRLALVRAANVMTREPITVWPEMPIEDAARILYERKFGSLPVLDGEKLVGIVTDNDIFRVFVALTGVLAPSSRLTIALPEENDPIPRVVALINRAGVPIVSLLTESGGAPATRRLIARLATADPRPILADLAAAGFAATWDGAKTAD